MRTTIRVLVLSLAIGGIAQAQTERHAVPTDECTPGSMQVILGLCTASQREQAKTMNVERPASGETKAAMAKSPKAAKPGTARVGVTIAVRLSAAEIDAIDAWIARQPDRASINRADAVHRLLTASLPQPKTAE